MLRTALGTATARSEFNLARLAYRGLCNAPHRSLGIEPPRMAIAKFNDNITITMLLSLGYPNVIYICDNKMLYNTLLTDIRKDV